MRLFYILVVEIRKGNRQEWLHYQIKEWLLAPQFPCSHICLSLCGIVGTGSLASFAAKMHNVYDAVLLWY